jgi:ATP-dependent Clp protease ATP-binding subunit ClpB
MLAEKDIILELTPKLKAWLAEEGYDEIYGARPLKRVIQNSVQNYIAEKIIAGEIGPKNKMLLDFDNGEIITVNIPV